jgi:hypothetical protein
MILSARRNLFVRQTLIEGRRRRRTIVAFVVYPRILTDGRLVLRRKQNVDHLPRGFFVRADVEEDLDGFGSVAMVDGNLKGIPHSSPHQGVDDRLATVPGCGSVWHAAMIAGRRHNWKSPPVLTGY